MTQDGSHGALSRDNSLGGPSRPAYDLEAWRRQVPLLASGSVIPMNNCSQAPQTDPTRAAAERYLDSWNSRGMDWDAWMDEVRLAKRAFASLVNASEDEIAVCSSVSEATSAVASALDFSSMRRKVIASAAEFPTVGQVWLAQEQRGAQVTWVPVRAGVIDATAYDDVIDDRTNIVSACHGYYLNGFTQDIAAITQRTHAQGALIYVDAYQTLGALPIDVRALDVDFLVGGTLKFLMGIPGIAFLYVKHSLIDALRPTVTGWFGRADPFSFRADQLDWSPTASRFDTGTPPLINAYVARAGIEIITGIGAGNIQEWHTVLGQRLIDGGRARGLTLHGTTDMSSKTASTAFVVSDAHGVERAMRARGVLPSARGPVIRLAPHFYNSLSDVDAALDLLADVASSA